MKRSLISILVLFISIQVFPQKTSVQIARSGKIPVPEWQILDTDFFPVLSGSDFPDLDSISFGLESEKRYYLEVSLTNAVYSDSILCSLYINGERILLIKSNLSAGDYFYSFFTGVREPISKITGGTNANIADFPWQVFYESGNFTCGGSIISGDWIITAAHCTEDDSGNLIPVSQMDIIVGANNPRSGTEGGTYAVSRVVRHPGYNPVSMENDIALLQLKTAINYTNAAPVRLVSVLDANAGATDPGVMSWVTGYGLSLVSPPTTPTQLQKVQLPIVSNATAGTVWPDIASTDMMAGYKNGNKDACSGDSGGPLVVPVEGEYKLAGLVSWGSSKCNTYGAYTRVSDFESWISSNTGIEISYVPPVPSGDSIVCPTVPSSTYRVDAIAGASAYEWQLLPSEAGTILGSSQNASVSWNHSYKGAVTVKLRVTKNNILSYWSALTVHLAESNNLLTKSNDTIICAGQPVVLKVESDGYNLNYSWYVENTLIKSGTSPEFSLKSAPVASSGLYRCDISGSCGDPLSPEINLTVLPVTVIKSITADTVVKSGDDISLEVVADGHNLLYQWQKDGNQILDGITPDYLLMNINASNTGLYNVKVSGSCGDELSKNAYIYVTGNVGSAGSEVSVWPTVVEAEFNVALSNEQYYDLQLFNSSGILVLEKKTCQYKQILSMAGFARGVYILNVAGNNFRKSVKLIRY
jgi:hypothetical protein